MKAKPPCYPIHRRLRAPALWGYALPHADAPSFPPAFPAQSGRVRGGRAVFLGAASGRANADAAARQHRRVWPGDVGHHAFAKHPSFQLVAVADVDLCRVERCSSGSQRCASIRTGASCSRGAENIDSVNVSIPDHMHCLIAMEAMKRGKAVYVQKPLCNTLHETRLLTEYARRRGLTTQMGIQVSSTRAQLYGEALVRSGIVGKIRRSTRSRTRAGETTSRCRDGRSRARALDWDDWLGVSAPRPFKSGAITRANGGGASASAPARSATWAATSTARRIAR